MPNGRRMGSHGTLLISENVRTNRQSTSAEALPARIRRDRRPLQNRVTPFGDVVAISQRGLYIGNRGIIHDPATKTLLGWRWTTKAWLVCVLDYKGRRRELMGGRSWTELFFLDEAVALAAGHRPCFFCRRADAQAFQVAWGKAKGGQAPLAPEIDAVLHQERLDRGRKRVHAISDPVAELPDGAVVVAAGEANSAWPCVPLERARLPGSATTFSRRRSTDPIIDVARDSGWLPAGVTPRC